MTATDLVGRSRRGLWRPDAWVTIAGAAETGPWTVTGRPDRGRVGSTEADPGAATERSVGDGRARRSGSRCRDPTFRARSVAETTKGAQVTMPGRLRIGNDQRPAGVCHPVSPEGDAGRCRPVDASPDDLPEGGAAVRGPEAVSGPRRSEVRAAAKGLRGSGWACPRGPCEHDLHGLEDHPRVLVRVIRSNVPRDGRRRSGAETLPSRIV